MALEENPGFGGHIPQRNDEVSFSLLRRQPSPHPINVVRPSTNAKSVFLGCALSKPEKRHFMHMFEVIKYQVYLLESIFLRCVHRVMAPQVEFRVGALGCDSSGIFKKVKMG